jgi:hypothetical protein
MHVAEGGQAEGRVTRGLVWVYIVSVINAMVSLVGESLVHPLSTDAICGADPRNPRHFV